MNPNLKERVSRRGFLVRTVVASTAVSALTLVDKSGAMPVVNFVAQLAPQPLRVLGDGLLSAAGRELATPLTYAAGSRVCEPSTKAGPYIRISCPTDEPGQDYLAGDQSYFVLYADKATKKLLTGVDDRLSREWIFYVRNARPFDATRESPEVYKAYLESLPSDKRPDHFFWRTLGGVNDGTSFLVPDHVVKPTGNENTNLRVEAPNAGFHKFTEVVDGEVKEVVTESAIGIIERIDTTGACADACKVIETFVHRIRLCPTPGGNDLPWTPSYDVRWSENGKIQSGPVTEALSRFK